jgi:acetyl/propionyl-CoA carboxylase alpha subunit
MQKMKWYTTSDASDLQGVISDEETGKTIAVCYDAKYAKLIASVPEMFEVLKNGMNALQHYSANGNGFRTLEDTENYYKALSILQEIESFPLTLDLN